VIKVWGLCLNYNLQYISWAGFNAFHASCAASVVDCGGHHLFYGVFWASVYAVVAAAALSYCSYVDAFVVSGFLDFA
jgi:hypothetical protein